MFTVRFLSMTSCSSQLDEDRLETTHVTLRSWFFLAVYLNTQVKTGRGKILGTRLHVTTQITAGCEDS